ncbi:MAG TPA: ATP-binding protein [Paraburkholderia sp.]|uniref:ATP-binding protein n=1 Tax=Paraburkholderia sp. TaxID=1926495 RepID=UPI002B872F3F|nr:ATP-binding protein [Paraburkholderia sp.]HTR08313.1 ATP-binding protein [Paraburkholderia sp.]
MKPAARTPFTPDSDVAAGAYDGWPIHGRYRTTVVGGILLVALVCVAAFYNLHQDRQTSLAAGHRTVELVARVLADQIGSTIDPIPATLQHEADLTPGLAGKDAFAAFEQGARARIPQIRSLKAGGCGFERDIVDDARASGAWVHSCWPSSAHAAASPAAGEATFPLLVRLAAQNGRGVVPVVANIDCGALLARMADMARDEHLILTLAGKGAASGFRCSVSASLGQEELNDLETARFAVPGYPLTFEVGRPRADILRDWRRNTWATLARTLAISSFVLVLLYLMVRQVRRQALANRELRAGEQRWRAVFDDAPVGIVMLLPNQPYMVANPAFKRMVGYSLDELHQLAPSDITHPDDIELTRAKVAELERGERSTVKFEKRYLHRDGRVIWTEITISRLSETGALGGMLVAVIDDVSARREAEAERLRLEAQLRQSQKLEALGTFAGGIAHDFNNILSAILGYGERVFRALGADSPLRRDAQQVLNAGMRASLLVERILAFSRSGMTARLPVHVEPVLVETVELFKASLPPEVKVILQLDAPQAYVVGDPTHLHQVVMNLCSNARHALEGQGTITVSVREVAPGESRALHSGTLQPGDYVCIGVADTGAGISPEVQERMFDPFFTTRKTIGGTGLGLSLVDGIVKEYGGAIEVRSELGRGTQFNIYLPLSAQQPAAPPTPAIETCRGNGETVLLVDDERALVELCEDLLAELGYEPLGFSSPREALEAFLADPQRFDLVLTDHTMPEMTGIDLIRQIRSVRPDLPVLLMSGYGTHVVEEESRSLGVRAVLKKPVLCADLTEAVRDALTRESPC